MKAIIVILSVGGLAFLAIGLIIFSHARQSLGWMETEGRIIAHQIRSTYEAKQMKPAVVVRYAYQVNGTRYEGDRFSHSQLSPAAAHSDPERAMRDFKTSPAMKPWQIGNAIPVYYDPHHPNDSALRKGSWGLGGGLIALGTGLILCAYFNWRDRSRSNRSK